MIQTVNRKQQRSIATHSSVDQVVPNTLILKRLQFRSLVIIQCYLRTGRTGTVKAQRIVPDDAGGLDIQP